MSQGTALHLLAVSSSVTDHCEVKSRLDQKYWPAKNLTFCAPDIAESTRIFRHVSFESARTNVELKAL